jgi:hypothetical protein
MREAFVRDRECERAGFLIGFCDFRGVLGGGGELDLERGEEGVVLEVAGMWRR